MRNVRQQSVEHINVEGWYAITSFYGNDQSLPKVQHSAFDVVLSIRIIERTAQKSGREVRTEFGIFSCPAEQGLGHCSKSRWL